VPRNRPVMWRCVACLRYIPPGPVFWYSFVASATRSTPTVLGPYCGNCYGA
jgi:hypothetical protein